LWAIFSETNGQAVVLTAWFRGAKCRRADSSEERDESVWNDLWWEYQRCLW
jgi:hypothetical protein